MTGTELKNVKVLAANIRIDILKMLEKRGYGHLGGSLSIADLMYCTENNYAMMQKILIGMKEI